MPKVRTAKHTITTILVPTDFSEYSRQALSYAEMGVRLGVTAR